MLVGFGGDRGRWVVVGRILVSGDECVWVAKDSFLVRFEAHSL